METGFSSLGLSVTAEGAETAEQLRVVRELGADHVQGYLLGRPGDVRTLAAAFASWTPV